MGKRRTTRPAPPTRRTLHLEAVADELDLHGFTLDQAEARLEAFLETHSVRSPGRVVRVVTGRGARSSGPPVLMSAVREGLDGWLRPLVSDWAVDLGGGAYLVKLRR